MIQRTPHLTRSQIIGSITSAESQESDEPHLSCVILCQSKENIKALHVYMDG